jgi:hypothetical protein
MQPYGLSQLPNYQTELTTRELCRAVHLDPEFRQEVLEEYVEDGIHAVGLPFGVNLVALVRHAAAAEEREHQHEQALSWLLLGFVLLVLLLLASLSPGSALPSTLLLLLVLACLPAAGFMVYRAQLVARKLAVELHTGSKSPEDSAPALDAGLEQRLKDLRRANIVVHHSSRGLKHPFVGSGWKITESVWDPVDIGRPAKDTKDRPLTPVPFTAADLHQYLAVNMPKATGLGALVARNRLYVRGVHVEQLGTSVLPDPEQRPLTQIPSALVKAGAGQLGGAMATYLCLRMVSGGGQTVVTMHIRAQVLAPRLAWEVNAYVLPPLGSRFDFPQSLVGSDTVVRWRTARDSAGSVRPALFGLVGRQYRRRAGSRSRARQLERVRAELRKGHVTYDYGAADSLRERVSDWKRMGFDEKMNSQLFFKLMIQGVLDCTEQFLTSHNIDTSDLRSQQQQIINTQTYTFNGTIQALQAGDNGLMNVQYGGSPGQGPQGGPGGANPAGAAAQGQAAP